MDGRRTPEGYEATRLVTGEMRAGWFSEATLTPGEACTGSLTWAGTSLEVRTSGPGLCAELAGTYTDMDPEAAAEHAAERAAAGAGSAAPVGAAAPGSGECQRYRDCLCGLSAAWTREGRDANNPFEAGCAEAERLLATVTEDPATCAAGRKLFGGIASAQDLSTAACVDATAP